MYPILLFSQPVDVHLQAFYNTPLGELYRALPFDELSKHICKPKRAISGKGSKPWFDVKGGIALPLLKSYYRCSDAIADRAAQWQLANAEVLWHTVKAGGIKRQTHSNQGSSVPCYKQNSKNYGK